MKQKIYLISGLGADERVFKNLDFNGFEPHFIKWIEPFKSETIAEYAQRLLPQITIKKPIILGVSFGGMIAIEMSKLIDYQIVIIVSSAQNKNDIPWIYRILGTLEIHYFIPSFILKSANFITYWLFGISTYQDKKLLKAILKDTDIHFLKWALTAISRWKNEEINNQITHIHGDNDKILPFKNIHSVDFKIKNGGHFMILNKATEMNKILVTSEISEINILTLRVSG
jgi:pimeloyl-ACP methyl ester carboxylesterase